MTEISFSSRAYCKIILHTAKYPHCAVNGLLLAKQKNRIDGKFTEICIEDAIPLFHICLHVSPLAEIALALVNFHAKSEGLVIAGYYLANENINDVSIDKPAHRIADWVAENYGNTLLVVVDNKELRPSMNLNPLKISQYVDGKWKPKATTDVSYEKGVTHTDVLYSLLKAEEYRNLYDFDNHLDDVTLNWQNCKLNKTIEQAMEKYK
ncbi:ER membrane protein complex subunit 8/9 homolog [Ceratina calcarata]|uniref:ER membrane protein complex subunit 8/9 homolog n=1 Tax=Ceratina calcarata TaxID=156304 RepID=A0AAJ7JBX1_9HYME|nr:ER membrane protein complex subunit 8/9 homolog [Ceratina calcarata]